MLVAVVDTNVWVSAFLSPHGHPAQIHQAAKRKRFFSLTSEPLLAELTEVLARPRLMKAHGESLKSIKHYVSRLKRLSIIVPVIGALALCRDPDDDVLLETAINGHAVYIVSRDEDLTRDPALHQAAALYGVQIVTIARFLPRLAA